ncbi:DNA ligase [Oceanospirillum beijerinckii]|uniref:DNA ligase n=1 Tax=Oceanospirillum beijerinckii TaxID=64976 RepID=UPI000401DBAE|nr:DNA ligase [Oceanospirillum beijerinckii]
MDSPTSGKQLGSRLLPLLGTGLCLLPGLHISPIYALESSPVMLASQYQQQNDLADYWISEKLDGVRAYWDGQHLRTRQGLVIQAPEWFTEPLPNIPLDGELWIDRGRFAELSGIVRQQQPNDQAWRKVRYVLFDLPAEPAVFSLRKEKLAHLIQQTGTPWISKVEHFQLSDPQALHIYLQKISHSGAEGLMLNHKNALYQIGRSDYLMKYKLYEDAEAVVLGYTQGKGQFTGQMGALIVQLDNGRQMKIGSGFSKLERENPPPVGSIITYRYNGMTSTGLPRFARFIRMN